MMTTSHRIVWFTANGMAAPEPQSRHTQLIFDIVFVSVLPEAMARIDQCVESILFSVSFDYFAHTLAARFTFSC